ncbi:NYN domain-containing protein [Desulfurivibrio sp. C05AmB]|uniref:NYN domain-containing protein n=1 Tax=Desulfurivibrio sp. C05AmB TaxID=3374371 RepID=UPI00376F03B6
MNTHFSTAILIDGGFFCKRYPKVFENGTNHDSEVMAKNLYKMALMHLNQKPVNHSLYRILYYDCLPFSGGSHNPLTNSYIDFSKQPQAIKRIKFFNELKKRRKVALRLGELKTSKNWLINPRKTKALISGTTNIQSLTEQDVCYDLRQKGVDMKIGLDIAALSIKRMVSQIILVSGDSDFVPAAKTARREGLDFILDPMWNSISPSLHEHIDGLKSTCPNPNKPKPSPYHFVI